MTGHLENIQVHLETERKRLADELQSKLSQATVEVHEGSPFGKREETATESFQLESRLARCSTFESSLLIWNVPWRNWQRGRTACVTPVASLFLLPG